MGMLLEAFRLTEQEELREANQIDPVRQPSPRLRESGRLPPDHLGRPFDVVRLVVCGPQGAEESIVLEPVRMLLTELLVDRSQIGTGACVEVAPRRLEQPKLERDDL